MRMLIFVVLLLAPAICWAEYGLAILDHNDIDGWVRYDYQMGMEATDPPWQQLRVEHFGNKDGVTQHAIHTSLIGTRVLPLVMTHPSPKAQYNQQYGTHEYCAVITPNSEFINATNGAADQVVVSAPHCKELCWDLCQSC